MYDCTAMAAVWAADGVVAQTGTITDVTPPNSYSMQNKNPCPLQFYFGRIYHWAAHLNELEKIKIKNQNIKIKNGFPKKSVFQSYRAQDAQARKSKSK